VNTTDEFWEIDGVSLHREGWNVISLEGRLNTPPMRGDDQTHAQVPGEQWMPKQIGSRNLTLGMWMIGVNNDTGYSVDQRRQWNDNYRFLSRLFWQPDREFIITRRWLLTDNNGIVGIQVHRALGQLAAPLAPAMTGRTRGVMTVDIKLAHPFFYGDEEVHTIARDTPTVVHNPGDYSAAWKHLYMHLVGPLKNPRLANTTPNPDVWFKYNATLVTGQAVTLDIDRFIARSDSVLFTYPENNLDLTPNNKGVLVSHGGAYPWMGLQRGDNNLILTTDSGTDSGHVEIRFRPPYL